MKTDTRNNTVYTEAQIKAMPELGQTKSNWRQRHIVLRQSPRTGFVVSIGVTFDQTMRVISEEPVEMWKTALEYAANGKVYESN